MADTNLAQRIEGLPETVQDFVFSEEIGDHNGLIIGKHAIQGDKLQELFKLEQELWLGDITLDQLVREIQGRFGLDQSKAQALAVDIAGYLLLPLDKHLGDVTGFIRQLGGDPAAYPDKRIQIETRSTSEAADDVAQVSGISTFDYRMKERLRDIAESYFKGIRNEKQVMDFLTKPVKTGGLEFDQATADRVFTDMKKEQETVKIVSEEAKAMMIAADPAAPPAANTQSSGAQLDAPSPEDEEEIRGIKEGKLSGLSVDQTAETAAKIKASIDDLYVQSGIVIEDDKLRTRLKDIIGSRLRDVRDQMETLETLVQPKELGGMSLKEDDARRLLTLIEAKLKDIHQEHAIETAQSKVQWVQTENLASAHKVETAKMRDEAEVAMLYNSLLSKSKNKNTPSMMAPVPMAPVAPPPPSPPAVLAAAIPSAATAGEPPPNLPIAGTFNLAPKAPTPAPPVMAPAPPPMPPRPPATLVRPPQVPPVLKAPTPASPPPMKPLMQDVKPSAPRLTGPIDELRATSLVDFRRLSKDPREAAEKFKSKISLLADQSFTKKSEGIKAWTESEVYRTYLDQMREALEGTPMPQVIETRQKVKLPYLSLEETQAVAELSRQLRY